MVFADRFQGRTAIVTGGAAGIGLSVAERLTSEGARVSLWDLKPNDLDDRFHETCIMEPMG
jgi:NAD(P)-dependent dehydrogenase (short-subunit alcohol dehydrogenase family)